MRSILFILLGLTFTTCSTDVAKEAEKTPTPNLKIEEALTYCKANNMNTDFCILVDMGTHSGIERLIVWDFKNDSIVKSGLVSHGCGKSSWSGDDTKEKPNFSNTHDSHLSSLGKYAIGSRAWSNWGIHIKYWLKGLDSTNSNAVSRVIVLHGWEAVNDNPIYPRGTPEGWGCPAVSNNMMRFLDEKLKVVDKPVLFWIYK